MQRLTVTQQIEGTVIILDRRNNPAKVDGVPSWKSSDESVLTVEVSEDGLTVTAQAVSEGTAVVTFEADADLGEGVKPLVGTEDFQVLPAEAVSVALQFSPATEQA